MVQEENVSFRGAARGVETLTRVAAVTVWKKMDLLRNGNLYTVGDVLMLAHPRPMYFNARVTRPGDSGAAVRAIQPIQRVQSDIREWFGMILGSDECGGYASYAEHVLAWARLRVDDNDADLWFND
jgi:hypothetical protein